MAYKFVLRKPMHFLFVLCMLSLLTFSFLNISATSSYASSQKNLLIGSTQLNGQGVVLGIYDGGVNLDNSALKDGATSRIISQNCVGSFDEVNPCSTDPNTKAQNICYTTDIGCFHGMAVAGFAAGNDQSVTISNKQVEIGGSAPKSKISYVRQAMDKKGTIKYDDFVSALNIFIDDVKNHRNSAPSVINLSLSFPRDSYSDCNADNEVKRAIDYLTSQGVVIVAASGNESDKARVSYPACMDNVVAVGSSKEINGKFFVSSFSNMSDDIDIVAQGENVVGLAPAQGKYLSVEGTSFAAPVVSGAIVLMKQIDPAITTSRVIEILKSTGDKAFDPQTGSNFSELNIANALISMGAKAAGQVVNTATVETAAKAEVPTDTQSSPSIVKNEVKPIVKQTRLLNLTNKETNSKNRGVLLIAGIISLIAASFLGLIVHRKRKSKMYYPTQWDDLDFEAELLELEYKYLENSNKL